MKLGLTQRTAQHLTLTPQLQQSIRLLQLSELELSQELAQHLSQNPFLELGPEDDAGLSDESQVQETLTEGLHGGVGAELEPELAEQSLGELDTDPSWQVHDESPVFDPATPWDKDAPSAGITDEPLGDQGDETQWQVQEAHDFASASTSPTHEDTDPLQWRAAPTTLHTHLQEQALALRLDELTRLAVMFLIEHVNDDGWLAEALEVLNEDFARLAQVSLPEAEQTLEAALEWVQQMDPPGVGAPDLATCLRLQLLDALSQPAAPAQEPHLAQQRVKCLGLALGVLRQPLTLLAKRDYRHLAKACNSSEVDVRQACELIRRLEPRPGRAFGDTTAPLVRPDVLVQWQGKRYMATLAPHVRPHVHINNRMVKMLQADKADRADQMHDALQEARWLVKSLGQRCDTLLRVSQAVVDHQQAFFAKGPLHLKPMVLREVADELGLHESTVSRITTAKYLGTPQGTLELKYFFTSGLASADGASTSSTAVRTLIAQWVADENPQKPLSDQKLVDLLAEKGIVCARRTVAKYRESLKIAPTHLRRVD